MTAPNRLGKRQIEARARWVLALLSGDYEQGLNSLRIEESDGRVTWCCLGVAQHLLAPRSTRLAMHPETRRTVSGRLECIYGILGPSTAQALGFVPDDAGDDGDSETLTGLNDDDKWGFPQIAAGVAWCTRERQPFRVLRDHYDDALDEEVEAVPVPTDFDAAAWAQEVLAS